MLDSLHIELTSRCVIACPACPRTWFSEKFNKPFPKFDLDNEKLIKFLDCDTGQNITHFRIEGNHGDAIYYPELFEFIDHWRDTKSFTLYTNGSNRSEIWWQDFSSRLTNKDVIVFSIDGDETTNPLYRVNNNWESTIKGLEIVTKSPATVIWRTILFNTNEDQIDDIKSMAMDHGADEFLLEISHRFGDDDQFKPIKFIDIKNNLTNKISAKCKDNKLLYISAEGYVSPCCWIVSYYTWHSTEFWKNKDHWNISNTTLDDFLQKDLLNTFIKKTEDNYNDAYIVCQTNCNANTKSINEYI